MIIFKQVLKKLLLLTECPPLMLLIHRFPYNQSPISKYSYNARHARCSIFRLLILIGLNGHIQQSGVKKFRSLRSRAYSHPQFQNVTTAVECSTSLGLNPGSNFMVEWGGKRKFWVCLTEVLGEGQLHSLAPALVFCPPVPFCLPPRCPPKTKKLAPPMETEDKIQREPHK